MVAVGMGEEHAFLKFVERQVMEEGFIVKIQHKIKVGWLVVDSQVSQTNFVGVFAQDDFKDLDFTLALNFQFDLISRVVTMDQFDQGMQGSGALAIDR